MPAGQADDIPLDRALGLTVDGFRCSDRRYAGELQLARGRIRLNTDLARNPRECLEYIVIHEMIQHSGAVAQRELSGIHEPFARDWGRRRQILNRLRCDIKNWAY